MNKLILRDHQDNPIVLVGKNGGLLEQVTRQRQVRAWYYRHPTYRFAYAPLLYIECEYKGTAMLLDSRHIVIRFFDPANQAERDAVAEAEALVRRARVFQNDPELEWKAVAELAQANEGVWLAATGHLANVPDKPAVTKNRMFHGTATWNEHDPVDPTLLI